MACKYIYNNVTYKSKEEFIEKVVLQEFPTLAGGRYAGVEDGMEFERINGLPSDLKGNQFLGLLAKDNNWVTFFIKSIIFDSAKKGYEKVLFPRLDTIIQIESQNRFKTYEEAEKYYKNESWYKKNDEAKKKLDEARKELKNKKEEVAKIKSNPNYDKSLDYQTPIDNLERIVSKAYEDWHSLQPTLLNTANFYEYELANRLDDIAGGNKNNRAKGIWALNQIIDEYGNTWNEISLKEEKVKSAITSIQFNLQAKITEQEVIDEVKNQGIVHQFKGKWYITQGKDQNSEKFNLHRLKENNERISKALGIFPNLIFDTIKEKKEGSEEWSNLLIVNNGFIQSLDKTLSDLNNNTPAERERKEIVKQHFEKAFGIKVIAIEGEELQRVTANLPEEQKGDVVAFYDQKNHNIRVANIHRLSTEVLIEEFLHPFINKIEGTPLYKTLLKEALAKAESDPEFKKLHEQVMKGYSVAYNDDITRLEKEYLTQAVSKVFNSLHKEVKTSPFTSLVRRFKEKIREILNSLGGNFKLIEEMDTLTIEDIVGIVMSKDFQYDVAPENPNSTEGIWWHMKKEINETILTSLQSKDLEDLREQYTGFFDKLARKIRPSTRYNTKGVESLTDEVAASISVFLTQEMEKNPLANIEEINKIKERLKKERQIANIFPLSEEDITELAQKEHVAQNILTYYDGMANTILGMKPGIDRAIRTSPETAFMIAQRAHNIVQIVEKDLTDFKDHMLGIDPQKNKVLLNVHKAISMINFINTTYIAYAIKPAATLLHGELELAEKRNRKSNEEVIAHQQKIYDGEKDKNSYVAKQAKKKIEEYKQHTKVHLPTLENLSTDLKGNSKIKDIGWMRSKFLPALTSGKMGLTAFTKHIQTVLEGGEQLALTLIPKVAELKEKYFKMFPSLSKENFEEHLKKFTKVVSISNTKNGEPIEEDWVVFLSKMDHYKFNNDLRALENKMNDSSLLDEERVEAQKAYYTFIDNYAEKEFTDKYYEITEGLAQETKDARAELFKTINYLNKLRRIGPDASGRDALSPEQKEELKEAIFAYDRLDSEYDANGYKKDEKGIRIAKNYREYKKKRKDNDVMSLNFSETNKKIWALEKKHIDDGYKKGDITANQRDAWYEENVRTVFKEEWRKAVDSAYSSIKAITSKIPTSEYSEDDITNLLPEVKRLLSSTDGSLNKLTELRENLQDLVKGYRDKNGDIRANEMSRLLVAETRKVEEAIDEVNKFIIGYMGLSPAELDLMNTLRDKLQTLSPSSAIYQETSSSIKFLENKQKGSKLPKEWVDLLKTAYKRLNDLSVRSNTKYYENQYEIEKAKYWLLHKEIKESDIDTKFKDSDWYQNNHIDRVRHEEKSSNNGVSYWAPTIVSEPLYIWTRSIPRDQKFIENESPTTIWGEFKVNDEKDPVTGKHIWINDKYRALDGQLTPRENAIDDTYRENGKEWKALSDKQKEWLEEYLDVYHSTQKTLLPQNQRMFLKLPGIMRSSQDSGILNSVGNTFGVLWTKLRNAVDRQHNSPGLDKSKDVNEEYNPNDLSGNNIYMKFRGRLDAKDISYNLFDSLGMFMTEAAIHSEAAKNLSSILSIRDIYNKNKSGTEEAKAITNEVEKLIFNRYDTRKPSALTKALSASKEYSSLLMIGGKPTQDIKNLGSSAIFSMMYADNRFYKAKDYRKALFKISAIINENHYNDILNPTKKKLLGQLMDKFSIVQGSLRDKIGVGFMNSLSKGIFSKEVFFYGREITELITQNALADAISKSYLVNLNGVPTPIMEVYEPGEHVLQMKPGAYTDENGVQLSPEKIKQIENDFKYMVSVFNIYINGNYKKYNRADIERGWVGQILLFMQRYFPSFAEERMGPKTTDYILGRQKQGMYMVMRDLLWEAAQHPFTFKMKNVPAPERARFNLAVKEHLIWGALSLAIALLRGAIKDKDDDDVVGWTSWTILNILTQTNNEVATFNPTDFLNDYFPVGINKRGQIEADYAKSYKLVQNRLLWRRLTGAIYPIINLGVPILSDGINTLSGSPKAYYKPTKENGRNHDLKLFNSLSKLIPIKGTTKDFLHPKEYAQAYIYFNGR